MNIEKLKENIDRLAVDWDISGFYAVTKNGRTMINNSYGFADRLSAELMSDKHRFCFSLLAPFLLGICVLKLEETGDLGLDDSLAKFIPEYKYAERITLRQLFINGSGISDYMSSKISVELEKDALYMALSPEERYANESAISGCGFLFDDILLWANDIKLEFEPGSRGEAFSISDNYFIAEVLRRIEHKTLFEIMKKYVFDPVGMEVFDGNLANTATYGCVSETHLVRITHGPVLDCFSADSSSLIRLGTALADGRILSKKSWKSALKFDKDGNGIGFEELNGLAGANIDSPFGYTLGYGFDQSAALCFMSALNEGQICKSLSGHWKCFRPEARRAVEGAFQVLSSPKFEKINEKNIWAAMDLEVEREQETYVMDAKSTIAASYAIKTWCTYLLTDGGRAIGLVTLNIDKKKSIYEIAIVLIDKHFQGRGYGKFLLRQSIEILKKAGAKELEIGVNRHNSVARHLYESLGFVASNVYCEGVLLKMEL